MSFKLAQILIQEGIISEDFLESVFERRQREGDQGLTLDADLCISGHLTPTQANECLARAFKTDPIRMEQLQSISSLALTAIEPNIAKQYHVFPYLWNVATSTLHIVCPDSIPAGKLQTLAAQLGVKHIVPTLLTQVYFEQLRYRHHQASIHPKLLDLAKQWSLFPGQVFPEAIPPQGPEKKPQPASEATNATAPSNDATTATKTPESGSMSATTQIQRTSATSELPATSTTTDSLTTTSALAVEKDVMSGLSSIDSLMGLDTGNFDDILGLRFDNDPIGGLLKNVSSTSLPAAVTSPTVTSVPEVPRNTQAVDGTASPSTGSPQSPQDTESAAVAVSATSTTLATPSPKPSKPLTFPPQKLPIQLSIMDLEYLLQHAIERDSVFKLGLYFIAGMTDQAAIFTIPGNEARGFMLHGPEELQQVFQHISISLDANTIFRKLRDSVVPYSGTMPHTHSDRVFFALFDPPPQRVYFFPVRLRGRNVCMLYGHRLHVPLSSDEFEQLIRSIHLLSQALEQVIVARKQGQNQDPEELTRMLATMWAGDVQGFKEQIRFFRPTPEEDDDFLFESPVVVHSQQDLVALVGHKTPAVHPERAPVSVTSSTVTISTNAAPSVATASLLDTVLEESTAPVASHTPVVEQPTELQTAPSSELSTTPSASTVLVEHPVQIVTSGRGLAFSDAKDLMSHDEIPGPASSETGEGTFDLIPAAPQPPTESPTHTKISASSPSQPTLELASFSSEASAAPPKQAPSSVEPLLVSVAETPSASASNDSGASSVKAGSSSSTPPEVQEPDLSRVSELPSISMPTPMMVPVGSRIIGGEYSKPMTSRDGAEISASYIESILMPQDLFGDAISSLSSAATSARKQPPPPPPTAEAPIPQPLADSDEPNRTTTSASQTVPLQKDQVSQTPASHHDAASAPTKSSTEVSSSSGPKPATQDLPADEFAPPQPVSAALLSSEHLRAANKTTHEHWDMPKIEREIILEEEYKLPFFNPPMTEAAEALMPLPEDPNERQTALAALQELSSRELIVALLHHFPGKLQRSHVQQDGTLLFEANNTPDGDAWNLLISHPQETIIGIQPLLYHEQRPIRLMSLFLLQQIPCEPLLPHLFRFLLDPDPAIAAQARRLVRHHQESIVHQSLVVWLRHQLSRASSNRLVRSIRILSKLQDAAAVPDLIDLLENTEPGLQNVVHAALIEITKQTLPIHHKKWLKWWDKVGSQTDRIDWLIEGLEQTEPPIVNASWMELRELTGEDFGFAPDAPKKQRQEAIKTWKRWRKQNLADS